MGQNNIIIERSMDNKFKNINKNDNVNNSNNYTYCSKCLKELNSEDKDIVKDIEGNLFCSRECRQDYWRENRKLIEEIYGRF